MNQTRETDLKLWVAFFQKSCDILEQEKKELLEENYRLKKIIASYEKK